MKVVFEHSGVLPVKKYGGIERILFWHMVELVKRGHEVVLFGHEDSKVEEFGIELIPKCSDWVKKIPSDTDIIHLTYNFVPKSEVPTLVNIQGNGQIGEEFPLNTVFVSKRHAENHGSSSYIYNAIDLDEYPYQKLETKSIEKLMFLAKGSWSVKNLKDCVSLAKKTKKHLHIAGGKTLLPSRYVTSYGMVGGEEKLAIFQKCDALLFPVRWHEPFGIAIIEAMAMGLPVFGTTFGSLPELINENVGLTFKSRTEMFEYFSGKVKAFDSEIIRDYVEQNFSIGRLTDDYLKAYSRIIAGEKLNDSSPQWKLKKPPLDLLDF
jgi:glycosyltransferase involved in cell wall biosynthesis